MDLRTHYPRSLKEQLGPYVHLPRIIDKCRATLAETLGEYLYPCPLDKLFLLFVDVSAEDFLEAVNTRTDQEILEWLSRQTQSHHEKEIRDWNTLMLNRGPDTDEKWAYFFEVRNGIDPTREDTITWSDLLDLEEGRDVPTRPS